MPDRQPSPTANWWASSRRLRTPVASHPQDLPLGERVPRFPLEVERAPALPGRVDQGRPQLVAVPADVQDLPPPRAGPRGIAIPAGHAHWRPARRQVAELQEIMVKLLVAAGQQRVVQAPRHGRGERGGQQHVGVEGHHHALGEADGPLEVRQH